MASHVRRLLAVSILALIFFSGAVSSASAATVNYYVDPSGTDTGGNGTAPGTSAWATIQYAISNVPNPTTDTIIINVAAGTYNTSNSTISINRNFDNLTIDGASATSTVVEPATSLPGSSSRVFSVGTGNTVTFENMTIQYGNTSSGSGAGIQDSSSGQLTLNNMYIAYDDGSGSFVSGGVSTEGPTSIKNSTFYDDTGTYAGALYASGSTVITNTTFFDSSGGSAGGIYAYSGNLTMTNSLMASSSTLFIQGSQTVQVQNSILLGTPGGNAIYYYNFSGTVTDNGDNIVAGEGGSGGSTGPYFSTGANGTNKVANSTTLTTLGIATTLADNGSTNGVPTLALQSGSQAIDGGSGGENGGVTIPATDARGLYRDGIPDIGPYEYNASPSAPSFSVPSVAASNVSVGTISAASTTISWMNGNGAMRAVFMEANATSGSASPVNGTVYAASSAFGSGSQIGSTGWYAVYNGTSTSVTVSNLDSTKNYRVHVVEYNGPYDTTPQYLTTAGSGNPATKSAYAGTTIYANSSTGSDTTGVGTSGNPYKTFTKAYTAANDGDTINLIGTFDWSISGETGDVSTYGFRIYKDNLTVTGQSASSTIIQAFPSWNSSNDRRVFTLYTPNIAFTVEDVTVRYGDSTSFGGCFGFQAVGTTLTILNSRITACRTRNGGSPGGSAIYADHSNTTLQIQDSSFDGNDITSSADGGAIYSSASGNILYITNTTFSGNQLSGQGGAVALSSGTAYLTNDTITGNTGESSALALYSATMYLKNDIVADSVASNLYKSGGTFTSNGYNAIGAYSTTYFNATTTGDWTDRTGSGTYTLYSLGTTGSLSLAATTTASNGTVYAPLNAGSIAIDNATTTANGSVAIPSTDQLGQSRNGPPDIGAYEYYASDTTPPSVSLTLPIASSATSSTMRLSATASDNIAVAGVTFYINGVKIGSEVTSAPYSTTFDTTATSSGTYTASAVARDTSNNYSATSSISFTIDNTKPVVSVTLPASAEATSSTVTLAASASDANTSVAGVTFYVDGTLQGSEVTSSPYTLSWDSTATSSGSHSVFAVALDAVGNQATSTSVTFTVANSGPTPTLVSATGTPDGATITWTTADAASSRVWFGLTSSYSTSTSQMNTSPRVTSHSATLSGLPSCTRYHFAVTGMNSVLDAATSSDSTFTTAGCTGNASVSATGDGYITTSAGGSISEGSLTLTVPTSFTATTTGATFQAHELDGTTFFDTAGAPAGLARAGDTVFNLEAYTDATTTLPTFTSGVAVTLSYVPSDVSSLDVSSLWIYRYDNSTWYPLDNCSVNTSAETVSCTTLNFSDFAVFGQSAPTQQSSSSSTGGGTLPWCSGPMAPGWNASLQGGGCQVVSTSESSQTNGVSSASTGEASSTVQFMRNLKRGMSGADIKALQEWLNAHGFTIAKSGPGSAGAETDYFGPATQRALAAFQLKNEISPPAGYFGPITRSFVATFQDSN